MHEQAQAVIETYVRPLLEADGGAIDLLDVSRELVVVRLSGTCAGCPGSSYTVTSVIEPALRRALGVNVRVEVRFGPAV